MPTRTARLQACYTGAVHDVLRMMGHDNIVLPPAIKALAPGTRLAGPVWTVSGHIDRQRTRDETLLAWCTLLSKAPSGHVIVCQPNKHEVALMGELSAETLQFRGVRGYIVDGGCRDTAFLRRLGFPVFSAKTPPRPVVAPWVPVPSDDPNCYAPAPRRPDRAPGHLTHPPPVPRPGRGLRPSPPPPGAPPRLLDVLHGRPCNRPRLFRAIRERIGHDCGLGIDLLRPRANGSQFRFH